MKNNTSLRYVTAWAALAMGLMQGCDPKQHKEPEPTPDPYKVAVPANFPDPVYTFDNNTITKEGFELGKQLFYDTRLSSDGTVSCGTCHRQTFAFADHSHDLSHGVGSQLGSRNAPALSNLIWQSEFFWDGGANHLEVTPLNALTNPVEMGETIENIITRLNRLPIYRQQFKAAFAKDTIDSQQLFRALAQFTGSLVSANSRYDRYVRKENGIQFTEEEKAGLALFQAKCASCHATDLFTDHSYRNNGLDATFKDMGRSVITSNLADQGKFKVPSLRNVALTQPYMHDGRFTTLKKILDHYAADVKDSPTLDPLLKQNGQLGIPLTEEEKTKLITFLNTLTDPAFCVDDRFKDPFNAVNDK
jgi:cytochrome c peroxidase